MGVGASNKLIVCLRAPFEAHCAIYAICVMFLPDILALAHHASPRPSNGKRWTLMIRGILKALVRRNKEENETWDRMPAGFRCMGIV